MNSEYDIATTTAVRMGGVDAANSALKERENILLMTQQAEQAVLRPADPGAWPADLRIALAARVAALNELPALASHYNAMSDSAEYLALADPEQSGESHALAHIVNYMDSVAVAPRDIKVDHIRLLQHEGVSDADIVRLTELNAFMAYQVRLVSALALLNAGAS